MQSRPYAVVVALVCPLVSLAACDNGEQSGPPDEAGATHGTARGPEIEPARTLPLVRQVGGFRRRPQPIARFTTPPPAPTYLQALTWTGATSAADPSLVVDGGDLDVEGAFTAGASSVSGDHYVWTATTPEGELSLRYHTGFDVGTGVYLRVRGVDIEYREHLGSGPTANTVNHWRIGDEVHWRAWYRPSTGAAGIRIAVNGVFLPDFVTTTTGGALAAPTAVTLGTAYADTSQAQTFTARFQSQVPTDVAPEFVILGDSTLSPFATAASTDPRYVGIYGMVSVGHDLYHAAERWSRSGIGCIAVPGDTTNGQNGKWTASPWHTKTELKAAIIQVGVNDSNSGETVVSGWLQTLVNQIHADRPDVKILIAKIVPYGNYPGANLTFLFAYNADIANAGTHNITGVDARIVDAYATLDNGSGGYKYAYDYDGEHENNEGRAVIANSYRASLAGLGLIAP